MKKKKQKNKRWVQVYSTTIRNVALKVNFCTNHKTNITSLNGYLIDTKTRIRHDADVSVSTSVQDARDIDRMVKVLIARATAIYEKKCTAATPDGTGGLTKSMTVSAQARPPCCAHPRGWRHPRAGIP